MCAHTPSLCEVQVGKLTQIADHFGHVRLFFDLALDDHARRHVMKDLLAEDVTQLVRGVTQRAVDLEDAIVRPLPSFVLFVLLGMIKASQRLSSLSVSPSRDGQRKQAKWQTSRRRNCGGSFDPGLIHRISEGPRVT